jgi:DNA mismatch repair protein MutS
MSADPAPARPDPASPMLAQYLGIKAGHPDSLLFYRMGDFYELFFDDAVAAARALDITLTRRGQHQGADIPMCGVPVHTAEAYLARLIRAGFKVAVCEQIEDPAAARKRGSKSVVERAVIRLVTPGTLTEDGLLDARAHNFLAALARAEGRLALAWIDLSTGDFRTQETMAATLGADLARIGPGELLVPDTLVPELGESLDEWQARLTPRPATRFDSSAGEARLKAAFAVGALDAYGSFTRAEIAAAGALLDYLDLTQKGRFPALEPPRRLSPTGAMSIDASTRRNLELTQTLGGERAGSLLAAIDRTCTAAGARLLCDRLAAPLTDGAEINRRLDAVAWFVADEPVRTGLRGLLRGAPDIARAFSRLALGRGGPRDLAALRDGLSLAPTLAALVGDAPVPDLAQIRADLGDHRALADSLRAALGDDLPVNARDGGFIAAGHDAALDELRTLRDESRRHIAALQTQYAESSGVAALKIRHNNVLGYYIEVAPRFADALRAAGYIHRQTMAGAVRFSTPALGELEAKIAQAAERALALELDLFAALCAAVTDAADPIRRTAAAMARLDVATASADLAAAEAWCRPEVEDSGAFAIKGGRHPVVEAALRRAGRSFVGNDCDLGPERRLWLVTGPNMAGKSTFLRQNAVLAVLAQAGLFVPATSARIGIVDRLFSRVGAADDLARGRSTFMVEMVETAAILNQAGPRALVILDEIGRGTATFDGLSIAWAAVEHLHETNRCRALFATHYHELTALAGRLPALSNVTMKVKEWQGDVVFLHEVAPGAADRSYGIQVGKLAGLPPAVVARAEQVLAQLEKSGQSGAVGKLVDDLPLFSAARPPPAPARASALEAALRDAALDDLSPRQALDLLYRLKALLPGPGP